MQWITKNFKQKIEEKEQWHKWFAWYPVKIKISHSESLAIWLEPVMRKKTLHRSLYDYWWTCEYILFHR